MSSYTFFRDQHGDPRARGGDEVVCAFLESDVQDSLEIGQTVEALLALPERASFNGNRFALLLDPRQVWLEELHDGELAPHAISREEFSDALTAWCRFIAPDAIGDTDPA